MSEHQIIRRDTGEIVDLNQPADLKLLDIYSPGGVADEEPRIDAIATISAGYREKGQEGHAGRPVVSRDGKIYLHDPRGRAPRLREILEANGQQHLTIAFPFNNPAAFVQERFTEYSATALLAYGDEYAITAVDPKTAAHRVYEAGSAEYEAAKRRCKLSLSIYFALAEWTDEGPQVVFHDGLGLYRIRSTSRHTLRNLRAAIRQTATWTRGQLAGVPFDARLDYRDVAGPDGSRRNVPCWVFTVNPPQPLTSQTFIPQLSAAVAQGRLLQLPPPSAESMDYAALEGPAEDEWEPVSDEEAELTARGGKCDARYYEALWFTTVEGSRFDTDENRAHFLREFTYQHDYPHTDSLAEFLSRATSADAEQLIGAVATSIEAERAEESRRRARERLGGQSALAYLNQAMGDGIDDVAPPPAPPIPEPEPPAERMHTPEQRAALERLAPKQAAQCDWSILTFDQAATWIESEQGRS